MANLDEKTQDFLVSEICSALSEVLDLCPRPEYKPGVYEKVGVKNGEELQKMMDKKLRQYFRLPPRKCEPTGEVTAFAPGMDVQPGKEKGDGETKDGEEEWSDSDKEEDFPESEDDFFVSEEEEFTSDAPEEREVASTLAKMLTPGSGWSTPPLYQDGQGGLTPVSLLPPSLALPPAPPPDAPPSLKVPGKPGLSPSKMPRLERIQNPQFTESDDWNSDGPSTSRRRDPEPQIVQQRGRPISPSPRPPMRPGSPAPWKGRQKPGPQSKPVAAPKPKNPDPVSSDDWNSDGPSTSRGAPAPPVTQQRGRPISPRASPPMRPGSPAPWKGRPRFEPPPSSRPAPIPQPTASPQPYPLPISPALSSLLPRRILGELPLEKDEFDSDDDEVVVGPSPVVSIPHHPNLPRPPTIVSSTPHLDAMIPNDENAPRDGVLGPLHRVDSSPSVFSPFVLGTAPSPSVSLMGQNVFTRSASSPVLASSYEEFNLPPATIPDNYQDDPDFDSD